MYFIQLDAHGLTTYLSPLGSSYRVSSGLVHTRTGFQLSLTVSRRGPLYGQTVTDLVFEVDYETSERLHVKIRDKDNKQVPVPNSRLGLVRPILDAPASDPNYELKYSASPFGFQVTRTLDGAILFDTTAFPIVFEDQYLELSTAIPKESNIYGFGESPSLSLTKQANSTTSIYARDAACPFSENVYGAHPFYMEIRDGKAHGVLLLNAHGQDVIVRNDRITWKLIGGIFEFYYFLPQDNRPNSVVRAYTDLVGKPMMISHWMLGWQHCRWGYHNIDEVENVVKAYRDHEIPLEVKWIDIDYMDTYRDFTMDPVNFPETRMRAFSNELHANKQRIVVMVDVAKAAFEDYEPYVRGKSLDVFVKNPDGSDYIGQVWPGYTVFPDWFHPNVTQYWNYEIGLWMSRLDLDGVWIDMNEPSSFCLGSFGSDKLNTLPSNLEPWKLPKEAIDLMHKEQEAALHQMARAVSPDETRNLLYPKYAIHNGWGNLSEKTMATIAYHYDNIAHYDVHSLYGHGECSTTRNALLNYKNNERPFILSRSTFSGSGQYSGHWTGDNWSTWDYLKSSIVEILNVQMFGISYSGSDICGFNGDAEEELCTRWQELGAFYPFARNHNVKDAISQEPYLWKSTAEASRKALAIRYALLPYFYTLFHVSNQLGYGVWRPLIFEYFDQETFANHSTQVLIGTDILISPVLDKGATTVEARFPADTIWYDWYTHEPTPLHGSPSTITLDAPLTHIPVHVRGGSIVPLKTPKLLVTDTFVTPYALFIALDTNQEAVGQLYIDDGHSVHQEAVSGITFTIKDAVLNAHGRFDYLNSENLDAIKIASYRNVAFTSARVETAKGGTTQHVVRRDGALLIVEGLNISLSDGPFTIHFI
ncbi:alpha glucosidase [Dichotomocladium elegans]|nr:alpha glucosidase [Dichotomocladium elegans]